MLLFSISFLLGNIFLLHLVILPKFYLIALLTLLLFINYKLKINSSSKTILYGLLIGFIWAWFYSVLQLSSTIPNELEGKPLTTTGRIISIPVYSAHQANFIFSSNTLNNNNKKTKIKLSWRNSPLNLQVGDEWRFLIKLKKIHGLQNQGGFDFDSWAFQEGINATGYVVNTSTNKLIRHSFHSLINQIRQSIKDKMKTNLPNTNTSPWLIALVVGERQSIAQENWEILRKTGTNHLMAIAGLHIGFVTGFVFWFVAFVWRRFSVLTLCVPAHIAGAIGALIATIAYSTLAGFSIPTQRACIMVMTFLIFLLLRRQNAAWQAWSISLLLILLINPLNSMSDSFWLSFTSVALIIYGVSGRLNPHNLWWKLGRIQWVIAIGLLPLGVWLFHQFSLIAFIANSIAIPWLGFIILPLTLLGTVILFISTKFGSFILLLADINLTYLWQVLSYFSHLTWSSWEHYIPHYWMIITSCVGVILLLFPSGLPGRWLGVIWLLPLLLYKPEPLKNGEIKFTLLDVGQGLSAVVQTSHHVLIFDTGARLSDNYDMGQNVVIPFLNYSAINNIDMMVISHGDNDHIGGSKAILSTFNVNSIKTSDVDKFPQKYTSYCLQNQEWLWDGVTFRFLYPSKENLDLDNNSSCVLKVSTGNKSILLTGDIEKFAEKYLVAEEKDKLTADILIAPHHGSKTSADDSFILAVNPQYVLYAVGYRNRYHFPNNTVVQKYNNYQIKQYDTVKEGAIQFTLSNNSISAPSLYRRNTMKFWRE